MNKNLPNHFLVSSFDNLKSKLQNQKWGRIFAIAAAFAMFAAAAQAQQPAPVRIGWISNDRGGNSPMFDAFRDGMRELGYVEGRNVIIEPHWGEGSNERLDRLAVELVNSKPRMIVTQGGPATYPVVRAGATMPIVFGFSGDPVEGNLVESFARPGRNLTGVSLLSLELVGKRMELLKEVIPGLKRVAILANPQHPGEQGELHASNPRPSSSASQWNIFNFPSQPNLMTRSPRWRNLVAELSLFSPSLPDANERTDR